jgi:hypothetical protein
MWGRDLHGEGVLGKKGGGGRKEKSILVVPGSDEF